MVRYKLPISRVNQFWVSDYEYKRSNVIKKKSKWVADIIWKDVDIKGEIDLISLTASGSKGVGPDSFIEFELRFDPSEPFGNAVIGIKMADEKYNPKSDYLWSWHIWISDYDGQLQDISGGRGILLMDRNLGAKNNTIGDPGSMGLLYQWGRKDPFVSGSDKFWLNGGTNAYRATTLAGSWSSRVVPYTKGGTLEYAVNNPTTFIKSQDGEKNNFNNSEWQQESYGGSLSTLWQNGKKTIFDPCPKGFKVARRYAFASLNKDNFTLFPDDENPKGRLYGNDVWFPFNGVRSSSTGKLSGVRTLLYVWTSTSSYATNKGVATHWGRSLHFKATDLSTDLRVKRAAASAVRCMAWPDDS